MANQPAQIDSSLDVAYPITFYGDATEADDATPIPVRAGDRLEADIRLSPVPALRIILHVPQEGGDAAAPSLQKTVFDAVESAEIGGLRRVGPGAYELTGVAGGKYTLRMPDSSGHVKETTEVNFNGGGDLDVASASSTSRVKATVQLAGWGSLPSQLTISLTNSRGKIQAEVDARGEANFLDVIPGKYDVLAGSSTQPFSVVRIATETGTISGHAINAPPGASLNISLSMMAGSVTVEGYAKRSGKAVAGAMIVLMPKDAETRRDCIRRGESDLDGGFSVRNVVPGAYTIVAIQNGWDLDWAEPSMLAAYLKHGQAIEVGTHAQTSMRLTDAVEVQAK